VAKLEVETPGVPGLAADPSLLDAVNDLLAAHDLLSHSFLVAPLH
jgi:hypothetical protein